MTNMKQKKKSEIKLINFTAYNEIIFSQEDTLCFHIFEEAKTKANTYRYAILAWKKIQRSLN